MTKAPEHIGRHLRSGFNTKDDKRKSNAYWNC